ncbi:MAG TPA: DNA recombination protein RmuC [Candidatus Omnitrophota bacterium]|nr:DNA recombination protein RmuC [Candidatus Omnitrophota bacterium]HRZ14358.1 DNA recombination protein RmuC [Candidatus Omnitrophota bacterium]
MLIALLIILAVNTALLVYLLLQKSQDKGLEQGLRQEIAANRQEVNNALTNFSNTVVSRVNEIASLQFNQLNAQSQAIESKLKSIQEDNAAKLEQMRQTVDEKLQGTLEKRLGESFKLVGAQLEQVQKGLGEMQVLASGVGDLKKVLTNVKTRGTWGEIQLGNLLEQILTPEQYLRNCVTKKGTNERVEFALKLPGKDKETVLLPIDAKFPKEDYERLVEAQDQGNLELIKQFSRSLEERVKLQAKDIRDKYIDSPHTTDFGLMFLPTEGLYAEVLRIPGLFEQLQSKFRVIVAGPTTIAAILNSLQMGFRTLAIEKRTSEVWRMLATVKAEFTRFGEIIDRTQKKIQEAGNIIEEAASKTRNITTKLNKVQEVPSEHIDVIQDKNSAQE